VRGPGIVPSIIAHRGASAYLPEHSLAAKALAYGMGADFLEQDVLASRDGELLVLHDLFLDAVSDVVDKFPTRARADGHFYCIDFDLNEIHTLNFGERLDPVTGELRYAGRFPRNAGMFPAVTLREEIRFVQGLNKATGRRVGIYPELKHAAWHREQGIDLTEKVLELLGHCGYLTEDGDPVFLQCFDPDELKQVRKSVGPGLPIIQLLDSKTDVDIQLLQEISEYAAGIGPSIKLIYRGKCEGGEPQLSALVEMAHDTGLAVHPYTFRADALPPGFESMQEMVRWFVDELEIDGLFTDFTDIAAAALRG